MKSDLEKDEGLEGDLGLAQTAIRPILPSPPKHESDSEPTSLNFRIKTNKDNRPKNRSVKIVRNFTLVLSLLFATSLILRHVDEVRELLIEDVKHFADESKKKKIGKIAVPVLSKISLALKAHRPPRKTFAASSGVETNYSTSCSTFISEAIAKRLKSKLSDEESLHIINCGLFQDALSASQQGIQKLGISLSAPTTWELIIPSLYALEVQRRASPLSPVAILSRQACLRWIDSPDCLLRYVDESRRVFKNRWKDSYKVLEKSLLVRGAREQAWFYLASSFYATKERDFNSSQIFLEKAKGLLKDMPDPFLDREIYRSATINAFIANDGALMKKAKSLRPADRISEDPRAFLDVTLLEKLPNVKAKELIQEYLQTPEATGRFLSDSRFVEILLQSSQLYGASVGLIEFTDKVFGKDPKPQTHLPPLLVLYTRILIGSKKFDSALRILQRLETGGYQSAELHHLKGLVHLLSKKGNTSLLLAAKEFQSAAGLSRSDESFFAMYVALLESGSKSKAEQVMTKWKSLGQSSLKSPWFIFASGIGLYLDGKTKEAQAEWMRGEKISRNKEMWQTVRSNIDSDADYLGSDLSSRLLFFLPQESPLGTLAMTGYKP